MSEPPPTNSQELSLAIIDLFQRIDADIGLVVVYQEQAVILRQVLQSYSKILASHASKFKRDQAPILAGVHRAVKLLRESVQMITQDYWTRIALDWSVQKAPRDIQNRIDDVWSQLCRLPVKGFEQYLPDPLLVDRDYQSIYTVFAKGVRDNPKVQQRLHSIDQLLRDRHVAIPIADGTVHVDALTALFNSLPDFQCNHEDFTLQEQIGFGASGNVYKGLQKSTQRRVAIKQLNTQKLTEYQAIVLHREIAALAALRHPNVVEFIGATVNPPYWIVTDFMPGGTLYRRLREKPQLSGLELSIIAFRIAEAMEFMHSHRIIHRDLKSANILLSDRNEPRLCDFGIARKVDSEYPMTGAIGTFNYMAPEIVNKGQYGLPADVFSFGMLMYEIVAREFPFLSFQDNQIQIARALRVGKLPEIPQECSPALNRLITDCWAMKPEDRPTFSRIVARMTDDQIGFPSADSDALASFYDGLRRSGSVDPDVQMVLSTVGRPGQPFWDAIERINKAGTAQQLRGGQFLAKATRLLTSTERPLDLVRTIVTILNSERLIDGFLSGGGDEAVLALLSSHTRASVDGGLVLAAHCRNSFRAGVGERILVPLLAMHRWNLAVEIALRLKIDLSSAVREHLTAIVGERRIGSGIDHLMGLIDPELALDFSPEVAGRVIGNEAFRAKLGRAFVEKAIAVFQNSRTSRDRKQTVLKLMSGLNRAGLKALVGYNDVISQILDLDIGSPVLVGVCTLKKGARAVFDRVDALKASTGNPRVISVLAEIAEHFTDECLNSKWIFEAIFEKINEFEMALPMLQLLGTMSFDDDFPTTEQMMKLLTDLLSSAKCSPPEMTLLLKIFANLADRCSFLDSYAHFLLAAESNVEYSGWALRVLARQRLPAPGTRYSRRLFDAIRLSLASRDEMQNLGAVEVLSRMARRKSYLDLVKSSDLPQKISAALNITNDILFLEKGLALVHDFEMTVMVDLRAITQRVLRDCGEEHSDRAKALRKLLKTIG